MRGTVGLLSVARRSSARRTVVALGAAVALVVAVTSPAVASSKPSLAGTVTLSGTVKDASGHGWPLYATVTINGATVYTNPYTGKYSVTLPQSQSYPLAVSSVYPGYQDRAETLDIGTANVVDNVGLVIDRLACDAPGYAPQQQVPTAQTFDGSTTPAGWTVVNNTAAGGWVFNDPGARSNLTGGAGGFAIVDSDFLGSGNTEDTYLTSPATDLTAVSSPELTFNSDYRALSPDLAQVDLSIDGGGTWSTIWDSGGTDARGPSLVDLPIPSAAGHPAVQVRFHYSATWAWWWEIDNVAIGARSCGQETGGLVAGRITHTSPAGAVVGGTVTSVDHSSDSGVSVATPSDAALPDGFYWLFSSLLGAHRFTATGPGYPSLTKTVNVKENATTQASFQLTTAKIKVTPLSLSRSFAASGHGQGMITVHNPGTAAAVVTLAIAPPVSWLGLGSTSVTVPKGGSVKVKVAFDAATADVTGPGTYTSSITVTPDSGPAVPAIPVTLTVHP